MNILNDKEIILLRESLEANIKELRSFRDAHQDRPIIVETALNQKIDALNFLDTKLRDNFIETED